MTRKNRKSGVWCWIAALAVIAMGAGCSSKEGDAGTTAAAPTPAPGATTKDGRPVPQPSAMTVLPVPAISPSPR